MATLLYNCNVVTMDEGERVFSQNCGAILVQEDKIAFVGSITEFRRSVAEMVCNITCVY